MGIRNAEMKISTLTQVVLFSSQSNEDAEEESEGNGVKFDPDIVNIQTHKHLYRQTRVYTFANA